MLFPTGLLCGWSAVVLSDRRYPSFRNFDPPISIDVIRMKSYMDSLFDPTCVPVRVTITKLNFFPNRKMPRFVSVFRNGYTPCILCRTDMESYRRHRLDKLVYRRLSVALSETENAPIAASHHATNSDT